LQAAWQAVVDSDLEKMMSRKSPEIEMPPEQFLVLITCRDEEHQVELLERFNEEGLQCRALMG
jgi:hypothetical protein